MDIYSSRNAYTDLPYELRNAILLAAVDPELVPLVDAHGGQAHVQVPDRKDYEHITLALTTFKALSQIRSFYDRDGLASIAKFYVHHVAEYFAHWRILTQIAVTQISDLYYLSHDFVEDPRLLHEIYYLRCTTFACSLVRILRLNDGTAFDRMVAELKHWDVGSSEAKEYDPDDFFEDLTRFYERAFERAFERDEARADNDESLGDSDSMGSTQSDDSHTDGT